MAEGGVKIMARLTTYIERMERIVTEIDTIRESLKELKAEIKSDGFNVRAVERVVALRRNQETADKEVEFINDVLLYAHIAGMPLDVDIGSDRIDNRLSSLTERAEENKSFLRSLKEKNAN